MHHKSDNILNLAFEHHWSVAQIKKKIHSSDRPVSNDHSKEGEGQQRVEQRWHHMTDGSEKKKEIHSDIMLRNNSAHENSLELAHV